MGSATIATMRRVARRRFAIAFASALLAWLGTAAASYGFVYNVFSGGSDDGSAIAARWQSRWFEPQLSPERRA